MGAKLLEIKNYSLSIYANDGMVSILKGVNLSIEKGESVAISGPSGSGKSMLALSITGLLPRYLNISRQGEISLYDHEHHSIDLMCMKHSNWENIRGTKIAMIFQDAMSAFNPLQTCGDQIAEVLRFKLRIKRSEARSQTLSLMKDLGLNPNDALFQSYPHQLSGGQLQRMMIAMALIGKPELIIADEPASNLDEQNKAELIDLLKKMHHESGAALIYITHDQDEAAKVADRLLVLNDGQLEQLPSSQIISMPDNKLLQNGPSADVNMISDSENGNFLPLMSISNVSKQFARKSFWGKTKAVTPVLNRVNLQIFRGETIGLLGPSGSGKSTLGRLILNLENPDSGEIFYKNSNLSELTGTQLKELRKKIQVVYQNPYNTLNPRMTVLSIVREPLAVHGLLQNRAERNKRATELLLLCGISKEKHKHYTYQLSGGQRQRVAIARAMILEPAFVVLDECVSSLDGFTKDNILELLNDFKTRTQVSYLFIAHDKHLVERFADRIFVLQDGKLFPHLSQEIPIH